MLIRLRKCLLHKYPLGLQNLKYLLLTLYRKHLLIPGVKQRVSRPALHQVLALISQGVRGPVPSFSHLLACSLVTATLRSKCPGCPYFTDEGTTSKVKIFP